MYSNELKPSIGKCEVHACDPWKYGQLFHIIPQKYVPQDIGDSEEDPSTHSLPINELENSQAYRNNIGGGGRKCVSCFSLQLLLTLCFTLFNNY
jgi:hypothetical protein